MAEDKIIPETSPEQIGFLTSIVNEIVYSPLNLVLVGVITFLVYKIFRSRQQPAPGPAPEPELPRLRKDFTVAELRQFDGKQADGRVLVAVNGSVYDVTKGKRFYGPVLLIFLSFNTKITGLPFQSLDTQFCSSGWTVPKKFMHPPTTGPD